MGSWAHEWFPTEILKALFKHAVLVLAFILVAWIGGGIVHVAEFFGLELWPSTAYFLSMVEQASLWIGFGYLSIVFAVELLEQLIVVLRNFRANANIFGLVF